MNRDLLLIPSLAIHMNRKANDGQSYNVQQDLIPLYGDGKAKNSFRKLIAKEAQDFRERSFEYGSVSL